MTCPNTPHDHPDVTCRELIEFLDDYVAGTLPSPQSAAFEEHLRLCPPCVNYLTGYKDAIRCAKAAFNCGKAEPAPIPDELVRAILAARTKG